MKMNYTILDRITILGVLPEQGNLVTLKKVRAAQELFALEPELSSKVGMVEHVDKDGNKTGLVTWDTAKDPKKKIEMSPAIFSLVIEAFKKRDEAQTLTLAQADVYARLLPEWEKAS